MNSVTRKGLMNKARDGLEAIAATTSGKPDLILLDIYACLGWTAYRLRVIFASNPGLNMFLS